MEEIKMKINDLAPMVYTKLPIVVTSLKEVGFYFEMSSIDLKLNLELGKREIDMVIPRADRITIYVK